MDGVSIPSMQSIRSVSSIKELHPKRLANLLFALAMRGFVEDGGELNVFGEILAPQGAAALLGVLEPVEAWEIARLTHEDYKKEGTLNLCLQCAGAAFRMIGKAGDRYLVYGSITRGRVEGKELVLRVSRALVGAGMTHHLDMKVYNGDAVTRTRIVLP